jgi:hypothetical protein
MPMADETAPMDNDELSAFVSSPLRAITAGVDEAARISRDDEDHGYSTFEMPKEVAFDVAVTARQSGEKGGGVKIEIFKIGGGVEGKQTEGHETVSRIQFRVGWKYTQTAQPKAAPHPTGPNSWMGR